MGFGKLLIWAVVLLIIIYIAVRLAIKPLLHQDEETTTDEWESDLIKLRDMGILDNYELEEIIRLYQKKNDDEQYERCVKILNGLKEKEFFTDQQVLDRVNKLKEYSKQH
jgi:hypothetical protein